MSIFVQVVLPVLMIFFIGYLLQRWKRLEIRSVSTIALYIMTPALVFRTFYTGELNVQYINMVFFAILLLVSIIVVNKLYSKINNYPQSVESGLILSTAFMNSGNYGAPIVLFAYGNDGFAYAVSFMVLQSIIMNFFGVYYAAKGSAGIKLAIESVLKMPATYAVLLALVMNVGNVPIPNNIFAAIDLIAEATIPTVMLVLGLQLAEIPLKKIQLGKVTYGTIVRLLISPLIAFVILLFFELDPLLEKVLIVSAAMPSAATTTMYAVQFDSEAELVSSITLITTLISMLTITILLSVL